MKRLAPFVCLLLAPAAAHPCSYEVVIDGDRDLLHAGAMPLIFFGPRMAVGEASKDSYYPESPRYENNFEIVARATGSFDAELDRVDDAILDGDVALARRRLDGVAAAADRLAFSATPESTPVVFVERRVWHRRALLELLARGPVPPALAEYLAVRRRYETPRVEAIEPLTLAHDAKLAYAIDTDAVGAARARLAALRAALPSALAPLLAFDEAAFDLACGDSAGATATLSELAASHPPEAVAVRTRFMLGRLLASSDPTAASKALAGLAGTALELDGLAEQARQAHAAGRFADGWQLYRRLWERGGDSRLLAHVDRSARDLSSRSIAGVDPALDATFRWMARRGPRPPDGPPPADPFQAWLWRRWRLRALFRDGAHQQALRETLAALAAARGRADRAFAGNLLSNLVWGKNVYDPDMRWGAPLYPAYDGGVLPPAEVMNRLLDEFPEADWALRALFAWHYGEAPPLSLQPLRAALRLGMQPFVLVHLLRWLPLPAGDVDAATLYLWGDLPAVVVEHPDDVLARAAAEELADTLEQLTYPWSGAAPAEPPANAPGAARSDDLLLFRRDGRRVSARAAIDALARYASVLAARDDPWAAFYGPFAREMAAYRGLELDPPPPITSLDAVPRDHPAWGYALVIALRHRLRVARTATPADVIDAIAAIPADHPLRGVSVAADADDLQFTGAIDVIAEWTAALHLEAGDVNAAVEAYRALGELRDASHVLQSERAAATLDSILRGDGPVEPRIEAGWLILRRQLPALDLAGARSTWAAMVTAWGGTAPCAVPDFIWHGEPRCLSDIGPILDDVEPLAKATGAGPGPERARAWYELGRYAFYQCPVFDAGHGMLADQSDEAWLPSLAMAERCFREVVAIAPTSDVAAQALYTLGIIALDDRQSLGAESAAHWFLRVAVEHPRDPLADDAIHWASFAGADDADAGLWKQVRGSGRDDSRGDMALLYPDGAEADMQRALHVPEELADEQLDWIEHSLTEHNYSDGWGSGWRAVWRADGLYVDARGTRVWVRKRYDGALGRQLMTPWKLQDLGADVHDQLGGRVPPDAVGATRLVKGDVLELSFDDNEPSGPGTLVPLRGDARPHDVGGIR